MSSVSRASRPVSPGQEIEGLHVVVTVGEFDEDHPYVLAHGEDHLTHALDPLVLGSLHLDLADLGDAVHQLGYLCAEVFFYLFLVHI